MILKYAIFTLVVSIVPMMLIIQDLEIAYLYKAFSDKIKLGLLSLNFELMNNILASGVFTFITDIFNQNSLNKNDETLFTQDELKIYTGQNSKTLYLAILGNVFDVSKATKYYGPGETYNAFTGRDGSRAFVTGDFTESGLTDDVEDLSYQELRSLNDWLQFYHKEYTYKGKLIGRYYDNNGKPTKYNYKLKIKMEEAQRDEKDKNRFKLMFPPCNVEWTPEEGSRVWCSQRSGGIERDWVGVPRKLYEPGAETFRCACVNTLDQSQVIAPETGKARLGNLEEYEDCHPKSTSCYAGN